MSTLCHSKAGFTSSKTSKGSPEERPFWIPHLYTTSFRKKLHVGLFDTVLDLGKCQAFIVSATQLHGGQNVLFVDSADLSFAIPAPPHGKILHTKLYPEHLMASSAIPLVFPPVDIGGIKYLDGGPVKMRYYTH